jgi:hypothetical protein
MKVWGGNKIIVKSLLRLAWILLPLFLATACAAVDAPDGRTPSIPTVKPPDDRFEGLNEKQDPVTRVRLGRDILTPQPLKEDPWPDVKVGPYELRNETLASALQLILDEYDISLAFESDDGLKKRITISNLHGKLRDVVHKVCAVADLYCHFEGGTLTVKKTETFVVDLPPINVVAAAASAGSPAASSSSASPTAGAAASTAPAAPAASSGSSGGSSGGGPATTNDAYTQIATGLSAVLAMDDSLTAAARPVIDTSTRVLIYSATQRSNKAALQYFERLRKNTALIIFETHIWEVTLNNDSSTGINWSALAATAGNFNVKSVLNDTLPSPTGAAGPITITPSYTGSKNLSASFILSFISDHGAVKTVSQPQITVLSGSQASLSVSQAENYVSGTTATIGTATTAATTALTTGTVTSGLTMNITSGWDQSTVYGAINITLNDLTGLNTFNSPDGSSSVQLPVTSTRSIATEIRVRPGDSILIGGMVSQSDSLTASGPGFTTPLFTTERAATKANTELVFLLRPRVVVFDMGDDSDTPRVVDAPKDGMFPPEPVVHKLSQSVNNIPVRSSVSSPANAASKDPVDNNAALPAGLSPEAFAPQNTPAPAVPEDLPASLQEQSLPVPLSGKPATGGGGVNQ